MALIDLIAQIQSKIDGLNRKRTEMQAQLDDLDIELSDANSDLADMQALIDTRAKAIAASQVKVV